MITKTKKQAQEEMVGFVLIIILITVIGLIFMFFMSRQSKPYQPSSEVESFLQSSLLYTTSCQSAPSSIQYLAESCYNNQQCSDGRSSCEVLNETMAGLIESAFNVQEESRYKAYRFNIALYGSSILDLKKGNSTANTYGSEVNFFTSAGNMNMTLRLYF
jgi:hypothetical protein